MSNSGRKYRLSASLEDRDRYRIGERARMKRTITLQHSDKQLQDINLIILSKNVLSFLSPLRKYSRRRRLVLIYRHIHNPTEKCICINFIGSFLSNSLFFCTSLGLTILITITVSAAFLIYML